MMCVSYQVEAAGKRRYSSLTMVTDSSINGCRCSSYSLFLCEADACCVVCVQHTYITPY